MDANYPADMKHLAMTTSDRGLHYMPLIPATYAGTVTGQVEVHQSSSADGPAIWLKVTGEDQFSIMVHLSTVNADRLGEQLRTLAEIIDHDWATS